MIEKLKPCPFCNSETLTISGNYMIQCEECRTIFTQPIRKNKREQKSILDIWEKRKEV